MLRAVQISRTLGTALRRLTPALLSGAAVVSLAGAAGAQTAPASQSGPAATPADNGGVAEVVVTSRYRRESVNQVPLAVSVFEGAQASARNLNDIQDISAQIPSVDFRTGASNKDRTLFVRGLGTITTSPGVEPSVSTVIDGVVMARPGMATQDTLFLDRIEVLRGPQGTLFGKNASAGVISINTLTPTDQFHAYAEGAYFSGDEFRVSTGVSGAIIPGTLDGQVGVFDSGYKGNVHNNFTHSDVNGYRHEGLRGKLVYKPTENLTATFGFDATHSIDTVPTSVFISGTQAHYPYAPTTNTNLLNNLAASGVTPSLDNRTISDTENSNVHDNNGGVSAQIDYKLPGGFLLTSISAYRHWLNHQIQDYDALSLLDANFPVVRDDGHVNFSSSSEELRLTSPKGGFIDYVVGTFFLKATDNEVYNRALTQLVGGATVANSGTARYGAADRNYAIYGEANVNFTSRLRAILGFRFVDDDLTYYETRVSTAPTAVTAIQPSLPLSSGSTSESGYGDRIGLQYDVARNINVYATYSRGYKGPAFNVFFNFLSPRDTIALKPETSNSYEAGIKAGLFDRRVQANLAVYTTEFQNYQANFNDVVAGAVVTRLVNAGKVESKGVEGDITARPISPLYLTFSFASTDAKVKHFICPSNAPVSCNIDGKVLPFAPKFKMDVNARYVLPVAAGMNLEFQTDYNYQTQTQFSLSETPDTVQPAYGVWNGSVTLVNLPQDWRVSGIVKNIADQHYSSAIGYGNLGGLVRFVPRDDNRYYGVYVRKDF